MGPKKVIWCHLFFPFFSRGASPNKQFWAPHETECVWHSSSMVRGWGLYLPPLSQYYSMWDTVRDSSQLLLNLRWTSRDLGKGLWQIQNHGLLFVDCPSMMHRSLLYDGSITLSCISGCQELMHPAAGSRWARPPRWPQPTKALMGGKPMPELSTTANLHYTLLSFFRQTTLFWTASFRV